MKKFFVFLMVAIIAVASVFAVDPNATQAASTGTAAIDVKVTVNATFPVYQLKIGETASRNVTASPVAAMNTNAVEPPMYDATSDLVADLTDGTADSLVFNINQISNSRCNAIYTFSVTASDLVLVASETGAKDPITRDLYNTLNSDGTAIAAVQADEKFVMAGVTLAASSIAAPNNNKVATALEGGKVKATYTGANISTSSLTLGTATVQWTGNVDAKAGEYQARVILTVESV